MTANPVIIVSMGGRSRYGVGGVTAVFPGITQIFICRKIMFCGGLNDRLQMTFYFLLL